MKTVANSFPFVGMCYFCKTTTLNYLCSSAAVPHCLKYRTLTE